MINDSLIQYGVSEGLDIMYGIALIVSFLIIVFGVLAIQFWFWYKEKENMNYPELNPYQESIAPWNQEYPLVDEEREFTAVFGLYSNEYECMDEKIVVEDNECVWSTIEAILKEKYKEDFYELYEVL